MTWVNDQYLPSIFSLRIIIIKDLNGEPFSPSLGESGVFSQGIDDESSSDYRLLLPFLSGFSDPWVNPVSSRSIR